jgi:uncharacterized membrane protein
MFVSGVLVIVPVIATVVVLHFLFRQVDGILSPILKRFLGYSIPGMGLLATILLILLAGALVRNVIGSRLFSIGELLFIRTPLVRTVYSAAKQLVEAVTLPHRKVRGGGDSAAPQSLRAGGVGRVPAPGHIRDRLCGRTYASS